MKNRISLLLCIALLLTCLSACGGEVTESPYASDQVAESTPEVTKRPLEVPDSQLEYDVNNFANEVKTNPSYRSNTENLKKSVYDDFNTAMRRGEISRWEARHDVNEELHIDTVTLYIYVDIWPGTLLFVNTRSYQYSRENDTWSLKDILSFKSCEFYEYNSDYINNLCGYTFRGECIGKITIPADTYSYELDIIGTDPDTSTITLNYIIMKTGENGQAWRDNNVEVKYAGIFGGYGTLKCNIGAIIPFGDKELAVYFAEGPSIEYATVNELDS